MWSPGKPGNLTVGQSPAWAVGGNTKPRIAAQPGAISPGAAGRGRGHQIRRADARQCLALHRAAFGGVAKRGHSSLRRMTSIFSVLSQVRLAALSRMRTPTSPEAPCPTSRKKHWTVGMTVHMAPLTTISQVFAPTFKMEQMANRCGERSWINAIGGCSGLMW